MLRLYYHPFASYCHKVLIALYEKDLPFEPVLINLGDPDDRERLRSVWPMMKFPVLEDTESGRIWPESSVIIELLDGYAPETPRMVPTDREQALRARISDRFFDNFIADHVTKCVVDSMRPEGRKDPEGVNQAKAAIRAAYDHVDADIGEGPWGAGEAFTLADCSAAPALFYAGLILPRDDHPRLDAYYKRLRARPSFKRVVEEARPYRQLMPLPWPRGYEQEGETP
jgi:glutathione S-transferase